MSLEFSLSYPDLDIVFTGKYFMRFQLFNDDFGNYLIVDTVKNEIVGKIRLPKPALRICQKLNKADKDERISAKIH